MTNQPTILLIAFKRIREPGATCGGYAELAAVGILSSSKCIDNPAYIVAPVVWMRAIRPHRRRPFCLHNGNLYEMKLAISGAGYTLAKSDYKLPKQLVEQYLATLSE